VLPPAVDTSVFRAGDRTEARWTLGIPDAAKMLVWVGRMVEVKALDVLLSACRQVEARHGDLRLYLVGDGPLRAALAAQAQAEGLGDRVMFAGRVPQADLATWYRAANLTVLPSRWEGTRRPLHRHACGRNPPARARER
jgi:glycosyltransferase involved in cell wall biosynthesis